MRRRTPRYTLADTLFPYTTLFRSCRGRYETALAREKRAGVLGEAQGRGHVPAQRHRCAAGNFGVMVAECRDGLAKGRSAVHVQPQIRLVDKPHAKAKAFTETAVIARRAIALILEDRKSVGGGKGVSVGRR